MRGRTRDKVARDTSVFDICLELGKTQEGITQPTTLGCFFSLRHFGHFFAEIFRSFFAETSRSLCSELY